MSIRERIDGSPMGGRQLAIVSICLGILMTEGYDLLLMAFAASSVAKEWGLDNSQIGLVLSSVFFGMAIGAAVLAPLADKIGRRKLTLTCLLLIFFSMALAGFMNSVEALALCRLVTGLGIGGLTASLPVIITEFSPKHRRGTMIALYTTGLPLGGVVGGAVVSLLMAEYGWRGGFVVGAGLTFIMTLLVYFRLPESLEFLAEKRGPDALEKINAVLGNIGKAPLSALPAVAEKHVHSLVRQLFSAEQALKTIVMSAIFFFLMAAFYVAVSWTPTFLIQSGLKPEDGIHGGTILNLGGVAGTLAFSGLAIYLSTRILATSWLVLTTVAFVVLSFVIGNSSLVLAAVMFMGVCLNASASGMFGLAPGLFPAAIRNTAVGWVTAIGRVGAILAPASVGVLLDNEFTPELILQCLTVPLMLSAVAVWWISKRTI